ncbi:hypothetical protein [Sphingobacterium sp.]|uniref:hypothetical protein n=1 Tax=Sphingobacterium sp. TaxID=341027 RepID=UPI00289DA57D|nr:hypothetical protein [Sphingobacterium sp.]
MGRRFKLLISLIVLIGAGITVVLGIGFMEVIQIVGTYFYLPPNDRSSMLFRRLTKPVMVIGS